MNLIYRKTLLATAVAALASAPVWAGTDVEKTPGASTQAEPAQPMNEPMGQQPMDSTAGTPPGATSVPSQAAAPDTSSPLYTMTPRELNGMKVLGPDGEKVGDIKAVVRSREQQNIQAVISSGGFLGIGNKEVAVPLDKLQYVDGKLHIGATKDELKAGAPYTEEQYVELEPKDQPISEFSAFEAVPGEQPGSASRTEPAPARGDESMSGRQSPAPKTE